MLERGEVLEGRYELERRLAQGGAAVVFRARDLRLERPVAIKVLIEKGPVGSLERFQREASSLAKLKHPSILEVFGQGTYLGHHYLVTEYAPLGSLRHWLRTHEISEGQVARLGMQVLEALTFAHSKGMLHRDLKPENVLMVGPEQAKLADFGLAKYFQEPQAKSTESGIVLGTPEYLAPEVLAGAPHSESSDLYAWACLLGYMASGHELHRGPPVEIYQARMREEVDLSRVPPNLHALIRSCLRAEKHRRPDGAEVGRELREILKWRYGDSRESRPWIQVLESESLIPVIPRPKRRPRFPGSWWQGWALGLGLGMLPFLSYQCRLGSKALAPPQVGSGLADPQELERKQVFETARRLEARFEDGRRFARFFASMFEAIRSRDLFEYSERELEAVRRLSTRAFVDDLVAPLASYGLDSTSQAKFRTWLTDPELGFDLRMDLYRSLDRVAEAQAMVEDVGGEFPWDLIEARQAFFPLEVEAVSPPTQPDPKARVLFAWEKAVDRDYPILFVGNPETVFAGAESGTLLQRERQGFRRQDHLEIDLEFSLSSSEIASGSQPRIEVSVANFFPFRALDFSLNGRRFTVLGRHRPDRGVVFDRRYFPDQRLRVSFPKEALNLGANRLRISSRPFPGYATDLLLWIDHVTLSTET